jgi:hypothetical protein
MGDHSGAVGVSTGARNNASTCSVKRETVAAASSPSISHSTNSAAERSESKPSGGGSGSSGPAAAR